MRYIRLFKNLSNWWLYLGYKLGVTRGKNLLFRTRNNVVIEVPRTLIHEFKEIFMEECYMMKLDTRVPPEPVIMDVGANAGFFSLFAASRFPGARIFSYEPVANNFRQLERNRRLNGNISITCVQEAVYGHSGEISLSFDPGDSFTTYANVFGGSRPGDEPVRVPCVTLEEVLEKHDIACCDILKMDCEGSEYSILYNCPAECLHRISRMAIEVHRGTAPDQNMEALSGYLASHGFATRRYGHMLWALHLPPNNLATRSFRA